MIEREKKNIERDEKREREKEVPNCLIEVCVRDALHLNSPLPVAAASSSKWPILEKNVSFFPFPGRVFKEILAFSKM